MMTGRLEEPHQDDETLQDNNKQRKQESGFICVFCRTPCLTLYRQYYSTTTTTSPSQPAASSSSSSIKLTACAHCGKDVDPYIEREWLLVALDCILLRLPAYRHVLFHRIPTNTGANRNDSVDSNSKLVLSYQQMIQSLLASSILQSYLVWEAIRTTTTTNDDELVVSFDKLMVHSIVNMLVLWACGFAVIRFLERTTTTTTNSTTTTVISHCQVFLAVLLPTTFYVLAILVLIWENTKTVRLLASLFVLVFQSTAVYCLVEQQTTERRQQQQQQHFYWCACWFCSWLILAVTCRALVGWGVAQVLLGRDDAAVSQPCAGFEWSVWGNKRFCLF